MKYIRLLIIMAVLAVACPIYADSLAVGPAADNASIFCPRVARNVGDLVTIVLSETTTSSITLVNNISRDNSITVGGNSTPSQFNAYGVVFGGIGNAKNKDNNTRTSSLQQSTTSTLSARIMEILPNGDFAIEASRTLLINTEPQVIKIKGTIRPLDIGMDNSIASSRICNAHIICDGLGRDANHHRSQGIMQQLRRILF